uniref:Uncharacterized protein n=1 Tax=Aegilops tauschii TaxID=37682 RepID=M8BR21_AEGTA
MIRRLLNVVVKNTSTGVHSVRRIDPYKHLFYESAGEPAASIANKAKDCALEMQALSLPEPAVSFSPSPTTLPLMGGIDLFAPMGGGEGRIVGANVAGESMLYDADERLFLHLPWINEPKGWNPVCLSIPIPGAAENSLYVMERCLGESMDAYGSSEDYTVSCFEVLEHGPRTGGHEERGAMEARRGVGSALSWGSQVHKRLCALDLSAMEEDRQQPPVLQHFEDLNPPKEEDWCATSFELVYLGDGKFCVAKTIEVGDTFGFAGEEFAVLTGVQILRGDVNGLRMIKHKSTCYSFVKDVIYWVL